MQKMDFFNDNELDEVCVTGISALEGDDAIMSHFSGVVTIIRALVRIFAACVICESPVSLPTLIPKTERWVLK